MLRHVELRLKDLSNAVTQSSKPPFIHVHHRAYLALNMVMPSPSIPGARSAAFSIGIKGHGGFCPAAFQHCRTQVRSNRRTLRLRAEASSNWAAVAQLRVRQHVPFFGLHHWMESSLSFCVALTALMFIEAIYVVLRGAQKALQASWRRHLQSESTLDHAAIKQNPSHTVCTCSGSVVKESLTPCVMADIMRRYYLLYLLSAGLGLPCSEDALNVWIGSRYSAGLAQRAHA